MTQNKKEKKPPKVSPRMHHWLLSIKVLWTIGDDGDVNMFEHNTTVITERHCLPAKQIGQAQQAVHLALMSQMPDPRLRIIDAHINSVSYIGCMTQDEFYTPPPAEEESKADPAGESEVPAANDPFALKGPSLN